MKGGVSELEAVCDGCRGDGDMVTLWVTLEQSIGFDFEESYRSGFVEKYHVVFK